MADKRWQHVYQLRSGKQVWAETQGGWQPYPRGTLLLVEGNRFIVGPATTDPMRRSITVRVYPARDQQPVNQSAADMRKRIAAKPGQVLAVLLEVFGSPYAVAMALDMGDPE